MRTFLNVESQSCLKNEKKSNEIGNKASVSRERFAFYLQTKKKEKIGKSIPARKLFFLKSFVKTPFDQICLFNNN